MVKLIFKAAKDFGTVNAIGKHIKPECARDIEQSIDQCETDGFSKLYVYANETWLGQTDGGEFGMAKLNDDGTIGQLEYYDLYSKEQTADRNTYIRHSGSGFDCKASKRSYKRGDLFTESTISSDDWIMLNDAYDGDCLASCEECGLAHDTEGCYGSVDWVITEDGGFYCKTCIPVDELLIPISKPADLFKAKDVGDADLKGYKEYCTLFCDSSGFGSPGERALTREQALTEVAQLLKRNKKTLYAGITDIGQFQVCVTLFKKAQ